MKNMSQNLLIGVLLQHLFLRKKYKAEQLRNNLITLNQLKGLTIQEKT